MLDNKNSNARKYAKTIELKRLLLMVDTHYWKAFYVRPTTLIFYNRFQDDNRWQREGADLEKDMMMKSFKAFGITARAYPDFSSQEMFDVISQTIAEKGRLISAFIVVIMTHGEEGVVYDRDQQPLYIQTLLDKLCYNHALESIPKVSTAKPTVPGILVLCEPIKSISQSIVKTLFVNINLNRYSGLNSHPVFTMNVYAVTHYVTCTMKYGL